MNAGRNILILVALCGVFFPVRISAQNYMILKNAREIRGQRIGGKEVQVIFGDVHYVIPGRGLDVFCDTTLVFQEDNMYVLQGNVRLIDSEKELRSGMIRYSDSTKHAFSPGAFRYHEFASDRSVRADRGSYFYGKDSLNAEGHVVYRDSIRTMYADRVDYSSEEKVVSAVGNIRYLDHEQKGVVTGMTGEYREKEGYGIVTDGARVALSDSVQGDSLYISGTVMEHYPDDARRFVISDSVLIQKGEITASCQRAVYDAAASKVYLRENPEILHGSTLITGREIDLILQGKTLTEVVVRDSADASTVADTTGRYDLRNELRGKTLTISMDNGEINKIIASQNAESINYSFENDELQGKNVSSSGRIIIVLKNRQITEIQGLNGIIMQFTPRQLLPELEEKKMYE